MTIIQVNVQPLKKFRLCMPHLNNLIKIHWVKVEHPQQLRRICAISYWNSMVDFKKIAKFPQNRFLYFIAWNTKCSKFTCCTNSLELQDNWKLSLSFWWHKCMCMLNLPFLQLSFVLVISGPFHNL